MSFFSKLFGAKGAKYNDEQLVAQAMAAITADPLISDPSGLVVTSKKGIITLSGIVHRPQEKDRIEGVVRNALRTVGLKHEGFINELKMPSR
jgi:osmotically-inducible protein OsmY